MYVKLKVEPLGREWGVRRYRAYLPGTHATRKAAQEAADKAAEELRREGHDVIVVATMRKRPR